ncbi:cupin domain-containing protein [Sedimenticola hydrogenitrophicus]|uniref:cupin domain-containing protein n=1 Tax=Sedimenticola hydrogenitrophicus TaxID=2967975 RepID=UPI0021A36B08|nr:cupin domain-containing protein [Sedimenticola hydrogenitrophicus]
MLKWTKRDSECYQTRDGSWIRELLHPDHHPVKNQSLAEARVAPGVTTHLHRHRLAEEIYHITRGSGVMRLGAEEFTVQAGDSILIPPGMPHAICNNGKEELLILCCCAPPYRHEDTELL